MIEVRNIIKGPAQLVVRSFSERRENASEMTVLNIPGQQIFFVEEERIINRYLEELKNAKFIKYRTITRKEFETIYDPKNKKMKYVPGYRQKINKLEEI